MKAIKSSIFKMTIQLIFEHYESFCAFWSSFLSFGHKNDNFDKNQTKILFCSFYQKLQFLVILIIKAKISNFILKDILKNQKSVFREKNIFQNILPREQKKGLFFIKSNVTLFKTKRFHFLCWFYLPKKLQGFRKKLPD